MIKSFSLEHFEVNLNQVQILLVEEMEMLNLYEVASAFKLSLIFHEFLKIIPKFLLVLAIKLKF